MYRLCWQWRGSVCFEAWVGFEFLSLLVRSQNAEEVGRINYVPITAVQRFDMEKKFIRNGVLWRKCHFWQQSGGVDLKTKLVLKTSWGTIGFTSFRMCDRNLFLHCLCCVHRCLLWLLVFMSFAILIYTVVCFSFQELGLFALMKSSYCTFSWVSRNCKSKFELEQSIHIYKSPEIEISGTRCIQCQLQHVLLPRVVGRCVSPYTPFWGEFESDLRSHHPRGG